MTSQENVDVIWQRGRLVTFQNWVYDDNARCSRQKLAEAGFFMDPKEGDNTVATCFICFKSLCWLKEDDPWPEHVSHSPDCNFVKLNKKEKDQTVGEFIDMVKYNGIKQKIMLIEEAKTRFKNEYIKYSKIYKK